ncbi:MAG: hypothetical protein AAGK92_00770 [Pseudomonadota bacterium]
MLIYSPSRATGMRQTLITGRVADGVTDLGIDTRSARLDFAYTVAPDPAKTGTLKVKLHPKPAGYFALALEAGADWPAFPNGVTVTLTVSLETDGYGTLTDSFDVPSGALEIEARPVTLDGITLQTERIAGAPFSMSFAPMPAPVLLRAQVLEDNDPDRPVADTDITLDGVAQGKTDSDGRFTISVDASGATPAKRTLNIAHPTATGTDFTYRPDFDKPLNTRTFSILRTI